MVVIFKMEFFFFGCWNRDNCSGTRLDYRKAVITEIARKNYEFGIIAGDNAYARYGKQYYMDTIDNGFDMLYDINAFKLGVIGNHDIHEGGLKSSAIHEGGLKSSAIHEGSLKSSAIHEGGLKSSAIHEGSLKSSAIHSDTSILEREVKHGSVFMPAANYVVNYKNARIIVVDTNVLNGGSVPRALYEKLDFTNLFFKPESLIRWMEEELERPFDGWTFVVGHQPIISAKIKKTKHKKESLVEVPRLMKLLGGRPKTVYLSADIHQFQAWELEYHGYRVPMFVAGTGGAEPDPIKPGLGLDIEGVVQEPLIVQDAYGYCSVKVKEKELIVTYHALGCDIGNEDGNNKKVQIRIGIDGKMKLVPSSRKTMRSKKCPALPIEERMCETKPVKESSLLYSEGSSRVQKGQIKQ